MKFKDLEQELDMIIQQLDTSGLLTDSGIKSENFLTLINSHSCFITLHDVSFYRPLCLNNAMLEFYGFANNWLHGLDYFYYLQTIHTSTYHSLLSSLNFFRKQQKGYLNLEYKLLHYDKQYKRVIGSSRTILNNSEGKPHYAITVARICNDVFEVSKSELIDQLSRREREIALLLVAGKSKKDIAEMLFISPGTVQTHCKTIYKKLEINKIVELVALADIYSFSDRGNWEKDNLEAGFGLGF